MPFVLWWSLSFCDSSKENILVGSLACTYRDTACTWHLDELCFDLLRAQWDLWGLPGTTIFVGSRYISRVKWWCFNFSHHAKSWCGFELLPSCARCPARWLMKFDAASKCRKIQSRITNSLRIWKSIFERKKINEIHWCHSHWAIAVPCKPRSGKTDEWLLCMGIVHTIHFFIVKKKHPHRDDSRFRADVVVCSMCCLSSKKRDVIPT